ncbi:DUF1624 domain-containing protein [Xinfangfangia sp. D13-10-4-6]|uniref:heparan-alpha-glucosaminide N-acetyltransferase n=1 Tax=Pseudogemmobacter hezensis TaxID=2737662 RepID=UPI00155415ED|nr:heparan-alpha-glucosaminide N-acetyltransferase [Pseudogemmobacter hezensis]NPD16879.1 DUF1624 domain-containing protein [Pseudogemmobacter hezensis]
MTENRLLLPDLARSLALVAMVVFHFTWDLAMFGLIAPETAFSGFFWYFARITAGSFIFLAGMGLWMAHGAGIRWPGFWRRLAKIALAAALVTLGTRIAMPEAWVFYGILHSIAVSSLLGLAFLRWPPILRLVLAGGIFALPWLWSHPALDGPLVWLGLSGRIPVTVDYEPLFPWFAPFLAGMSLAQLFARHQVWARIEPRSTRFLRALAWPGRHSLAIYLIHQPLLIGLLAALTWALARLS